MYELAKELNITNREILNVIEKYTSVKVLSHMSSVDPSSANEIITAVKIWRCKNNPQRRRLGVFGYYRCSSASCE